MSIDVSEVQESERGVVRRLMEFYAYDWSELDGRDVDAHGEFGYPWLDHYWTDEDRHAFLIRVEGKLAGFALVRLETRTEMAEFFILRRYRRGGVGTASAATLFHRFPGPWEVTQRLTNPAATAFWRTAIPVPFAETTADDRVLQTFEIEAQH
ncbi:GNAT family N-acetyltransferase [Cellulomonas sp. P5_C6]